MHDLTLYATVLEIVFYFNLNEQKSVKAYISSNPSLDVSGDSSI